MFDASHVAIKIFKLSRYAIMIITNEILIQDAHFGVTYIAVNMRSVKMNDYKLINKIKNGFLNVKMIPYMFFE